MSESLDRYRTAMATLVHRASQFADAARATAETAREWDPSGEKDDPVVLALRAAIVAQLLRAADGAPGIFDLYPRPAIPGQAIPGRDYPSAG